MSISDLTTRFAVVGATLGLGAGFWEAGLLYFRPRLSTLAHAEAGWGIWFLAPLINSGLFALLGALLAGVASRGKSQQRNMSVAALSVLLGALGAHAAWAPGLLREWVGNLTAIADLDKPLAGFAMTLAASLLLAGLRWRRAGHWLCDAAWPLGGWTRALLGITFILFCGVAAFMTQPTIPQARAQSSAAGRDRSPNIILITLDAARADHFSSYGYPRPTTPNIDRLAARGVLFENAIAPSSWTLPSHASMFTGLLPHQHGANEGMPEPQAVWNLAEILNARGYETAGFNANPLYGQAAWGLGQGFETFADYRHSLRYNMALTLVGRTMMQPLYERFVQYDLFCRRTAAELNEEILGWHAMRSGRPFFLFAHYFEPHDPYLPPSPYDRRFGRLQEELARRMSFGGGLALEKPLASAERQQVINGYDNGLSYVDEQVGKLLQILAASSESEKTYVILAADHGEAFGEHGAYGHAWTLHREVLHVPLIIVGPGAPAGLRIQSLARVREIFPTVIDLALGDQPPFRRVSLRRYWNPAFRPEAFDDGVISELSTGLVSLGKPPSVSLTTSEWHYIHDATGRRELYRWPSDPEEQVDLSGRPEHQATLQALHDQLAQRIANSLRPWRSPQDLLALDEPGYSFLRELAFRPSLPTEASPQARPVGMSQAYFGPDTSAPPGHPLPSDEDLLRTLPYR